MFHLLHKITDATTTNIEPLSNRWRVEALLYIEKPRLSVIVGWVMFLSNGWGSVKYEEVYLKGYDSIAVAQKRTQVMF
jgi:hypothetical protein